MSENKTFPIDLTKQRKFTEEEYQKALGEAIQKMREDSKREWHVFEAYYWFGKKVAKESVMRTYPEHKEELFKLIDSLKGD